MIIIKFGFPKKYLLLPKSLKELSKAFKVTQKGIFPYAYVNKKDISLDYVGDVPEYKYFESKLISYQEYKEYSNRFNND